MRNKRSSNPAKIWAQLLAMLLALVQPLLAQYKPALPGYQYQFPRDHFSHPDFQTEWWYYTGNVKTADGHRFGFELTFFRQAVTRDPVTNAVWDIRDVYFAHLALSDLDGGKFYHTERSNRAGPGLAGVSESERPHLEWQLGDSLARTTTSSCRRSTTSFTLHFTLHSEKPPVIHGENGSEPERSETQVKRRTTFH